MSTAAQVLDQARSQIGTVEDRSGRQRYGAAYGMDGVAWCAQFQWWCFTQAGAAALIPKTAYTPTFYNWFAQRGQAGRTPRVGALVFYNWPADGVDRIQHVGIVEAVNPDGTITTIEGNTTSGVAGNQSAGGGVWRRKRSQSAVVGYGYPAYSSVVAPTPAPPAGGFDFNSLPTLERGMTNEHVERLQEWLNAYNWQPELPLITTSKAKGFGTYGPATTNVVRSAQAQCGVTGADADGTVIGPRTKAAFGSRGARW